MIIVRGFVEILKTMPIKAPFTLAASAWPGPSLDLSVNGFYLAWAWSRPAKVRRLGLAWASIYLM